MSWKIDEAGMKYKSTFISSDQFYFSPRGEAHIFQFNLRNSL